MGPITIFDKSFLQSLTIDESVWFDNFYSVNICPLFYVETLADLAKEMNRGRTAEQIVSEIASKTPEMGGSPNIHHNTLLINNLLGQKIVMDGRPILAGGKPVKIDQKKAVIFDVSPERLAYDRWQNKQYFEIERDFAKQWRAQVKAIAFENTVNYVEKLGLDITKCKNIKDAFSLATAVVENNCKPYDLMGFVLTSLAVPSELHPQIVKRYQISNFPPLTKYAPYVAYVIKIEVFFHICVSRGFESSDRPSHRIDIAYLYYLPFCKLFVSGDKLHKRIAHLFMRDDQQFVWAPDLKDDLASLNKYYMTLPQEIRERGLLSFARKPPTENDFLTARLWDLMSTAWREQKKSKVSFSDKSSDEFIDHLKEAKGIPINNPEPADFDVDQIDGVSLKHIVSKKKGSWYQLPKDLNNST